MSWNEIVLKVAREEAEVLSDAFMEAGALSVSVEDADEGTDAERPIFGEPGSTPEYAAWERSRVVALINANADPLSIINMACEISGVSSLSAYELRPVAEQDWVQLTQSQFAPMHIGQNIWVVPSWHEAPDINAIVLELDPGLAFGTGSHPTTRLCMEWLEEHASLASSVLDYGCGSGILAMVAKKLNAAKVIGVDIDPQAVEAAINNAQRNDCAIHFYLPDMFTLSERNMRYQIVVANILANPLKLMAPMLSNYVAPDGYLLLSGILTRQAEEVIAAYAPYLSMRIHAQQDGWVALSGKLNR